MRSVILAFCLALASCATGGGLRLQVTYPDNSPEAELHVCHREKGTQKMWCLDYWRFEEYRKQQEKAEPQSGTPDFSTGGSTLEL